MAALRTRVLRILLLTVAITAIYVLALKAFASLAPTPGNRRAEPSSLAHEPKMDLHTLRVNNEEMLSRLRRLVAQLHGRERVQPAKLDPSKALPNAPTRTEHRLALLVPFRNAHDELRQFVPYMSQWLRKKGVSFTIFVINQGDDYRFNRGSLLNVGFLMAERDHDYLAMHDVDLLPLNEQLNYSFSPEPFHLSAPWLHPRYNYDGFIGGILLMSTAHFRLLNGLSTNFWGWGKEDDELFLRITEAGLHVARPGHLSTGQVQTFRHLHDESRPRDLPRVGTQQQADIKRHRESGLNTTLHRIDSAEVRSVEGFQYVYVSASLHCDLQATPWCVKVADHWMGWRTAMLALMIVVVIIAVLHTAKFLSK